MPALCSFVPAETAQAESSNFKEIKQKLCDVQDLANLKPVHEDEGAFWLCKCSGGGTGCVYFLPAKATDSDGDTPSTLPRTPAAAAVQPV
jgi:hypothetical protein